MDGMEDVYKSSLCENMNFKKLVNIFHSYSIHNILMNFLWLMVVDKWMEWNMFIKLFLRVRVYEKSL